MGKRFFRVLILFMVVSFIAGAANCLAKDKVYINGIDANFPPFAYVDKNGAPDGFDVKSVDWIAKEMGFKVKHQPMDWDGIIPSLRANKIDMVASGMSITDKRKTQVNFTTPYWKIAQVIVAPEGCTQSVDELLANGAQEMSFAAARVAEGQDVLAPVEEGTLDQGVQLKPHFPAEALEVERFEGLLPGEP